MNFLIKLLYIFSYCCSFSQSNEINEYKKNKLIDIQLAYKNVESILEDESIKLEDRANILVDYKLLASLESSLKLAESFAKANKKYQKAQLILADIHLLLDNKELAFNYYKKGLELNENNFEICKQVLTVAFIVQDYQYLVDQGNRVIRIFPQESYPYIRSAFGYLKLHQFEESIRLSELCLNDHIVNNLMMSEFCAILGESYFGLKNIKEGVEYFENSILNLDLDIDKCFYYNRFAFALATANTQMDKAVSLINDAITLSPKDEECLATKAWILSQKGEKELAISTVNSAVLMNAKNGFVLQIQGDILSKQGKNTEAVAAWKKAKELGIKNKLLDKKIETKTYHEFLN